MILPRTSMASEVVIIFLRDFEAIAGENQRRFDLGRGHDAGADDGIFTERERFAFAVADEGEAAIFFDDLAGDELDGLVEAVYARGFCARALELLDGVCLRFALATAAGVAAFEFVVGENFDVIPPGLAVEMSSGLALAGPERPKGRRTRTANIDGRHDSLHLHERPSQHGGLRIRTRSSRSDLGAPVRGRFVSSV